MGASKFGPVLLCFDNKRLPGQKIPFRQEWFLGAVQSRKAELQRPARETQSLSRHSLSDFLRGRHVADRGETMTKSQFVVRGITRRGAGKLLINDEIVHIKF